MAKSLVKYTEIFGEQGATTVTVSSTGTTITLNALPAGMTTANCTDYLIWLTPSSSTSATRFVTAVNISTKTITVGSAATVTLGQDVFVGDPIAPPAGMSQLYIRSAALFTANTPVRFGTSARRFDVTATNTVATNLIKFTPAIPTPRPADITPATYVSIGGVEGSPNTPDTISFVEQVSKSATAKANSIAFAQTVTAYRRKVINATDSITLAGSITPSSSFSRTTYDTITLAHSEHASAVKQYVNTYETIQIAQSVSGSKQLRNYTSDSIRLSDSGAAPLIGFTTPTTKITPPILPDTRGQAYLLFRHYAVREAHVNVYQLLDGTFVQNYPTPENSNTNIPLPWNPSDPTAPYSIVTNWNGTIDRYSLANPIVRIFYGGETTMVTQDLANQLRQAGYGNYLEVV